MPVLLLDNGDINKGYGRQPELKYETAMKAMAEMKYDAANVGEQDLLLGLDYLKYVADFTSFPLISANLVDPAGKTIFKPYITQKIKASNTTITAGIIGILSPDFKDQIEQNNPEIMVNDYGPILDRLVKKLRPKVDLLVLLAHTNNEEAAAIGRQYPGFDLIVASHNGDDPLAAPERAGNVPVTFAGTNGMHVGTTVFSLQNRETNFLKYTPEKLDQRFADSSPVLALLQDYQQMLKAEHLLESYPRSEYGDVTFAGNQSCKRCHSLPSVRYRKDKHAHAFDSIVEKKHDYDPECVRCHTVGFGYQTGFISPETTPNLKHVGCEDCHGPGSKHVEKPMEGKYGEVTKQTCEICHNVENSPKFVYDDYMKKINHNSIFVCSAKICHWFQ